MSGKRHKQLRRLAHQVAGERPTPYIEERLLKRSKRSYRHDRDRHKGRLLERITGWWSRSRRE